MESKLKAGTIAGIIAGLVMAMAMMAYMYLTGRSVWANPNLIAAMWTGNEAAGGGFSTATIIGFLTHEATSALMGVVAVPFIKNLPARQTILVSIAYALGSYPFVFALILSWANPLMVERAELVPMTVAHILFGFIFGISYRMIHAKRTHIG